MKLLLAKMIKKCLRVMIYLHDSRINELDKQDLDNLTRLRKEYVFFDNYIKSKEEVK
jgi:hypothetical protein